MKSSSPLRGSEDDYKKRQKEDSEKRIRIGKVAGEYHINLKFIFLSFIISLSTVETISQGSLNNSWYTHRISFLIQRISCSNQQDELNFHPLALSLKCISSYCSMSQQAKKSASRPWPALTVPGRQAFTEANKMAPNKTAPRCLLYTVHFFEHDIL